MKIEKGIVLLNEKLSSDYFLLEIESPSIARYARAGQFPVQ